MNNMNNDNYIRAYNYQNNVDPVMKEIKTLSVNYKDFDFLNKINFIDLSKEYELDYKLTSPNLLTGFIRLLDNDCFIYEKYAEKINYDNISHSDFNSSSNIFYVIEGELDLIFSFGKGAYIYQVNQGDIVVLPHFTVCKLFAIKKSSLLYLNDSPLLNYLGALGDENNLRFRQCHFTKEFLTSNLELLSDENNNRKGILLGNADTERLGSRTITPTLWALYNELPANTDQRVHKHNSIAIDLCIYSSDESQIYTLVGDELDENNNIISPEIYNWKTGSVFITPPGKWHSHHNKTNENAYILPLQDAGLLLYQRILGIVLK